MPTFAADDGCAIAYDVFDEELELDDDPAAAVPIVLHHGFGADANINWFRPGLVDALVDEGRVVVTFDARGHGRSDKPGEPASYGPARMARDVVQLADHLGVARYDLVGYSMGAVIALHTGAADGRIRRLVLGGIGGAIVDADLRAERREHLSHLMDGLAKGDTSAMAEAAGGLFRAIASGNEADVAALRAVMEANVAAEGTPPPAGEITAPTLVIVGDADPLAPYADRLAAAIPGSELRVVPGDHLGALARPELRAALLAFLTL